MKKAFFGIGILLEKKKGKGTDISQKEIDRIRNLCMQEKQSDNLTVVNILNSLHWEPE